MWKRKATQTVDILLTEMYSYIDSCRDLQTIYVMVNIRRTGTKKEENVTKYW